MNIIAETLKIENDKKTFYHNVILEKERFSKKPIFSNTFSGKPANQSMGLDENNKLEFSDTDNSTGNSSG